MINSNFCHLAKLLICSLFFISSTGFSQNRRDTIVSKEIEQMYSLIQTDANEIYQNGLNVLKIAKSDKEFLYAYNLIADGLRKKEKYSVALGYYKKVDSLSSKLRDNDRQFMANYFMSYIYQSVGLSLRAKETFNKVMTLSKKLNDDKVNYRVLQLESNIAESMHNYCDAIPMKKEITLVDERAYAKDPSERRAISIFSDYNRLAFYHLKCEDIHQASAYIKKADLMMPNISIDKMDLIHYYYMAKAIYAIENKNNSEAKIWFDKALESTKKNKVQIYLAKVLEQRINYGIDGLEVRKKLVSQLNGLKEKARAEAVKIIAAEEESKNDTLKRKENHIAFLVLMSLLSTAYIVLLFRNHRLKKKKIRIQFDEIIRKLKEEKRTELMPSESEDVDPVSTVNDKNTNSIPKEKEIELLDKLVEFEKGTQYLEKNFTRSNMELILETNSWYISIILQQHRERSFSDYINYLRIQYITKLLYDDRQYLNYKISYLSDLCGYSSHSRFAQVFKKETGISPSEFITHLSESKVS